MIQHLMLIMIAPPLLVVGQPFTLLLHASRNPLHTWAKRVMRSRVVSFLTWPPFGLAAYAAAIVGTHLTGLMGLVMTNPALHNAEHALYLVVGYLFFLPIFGREPIRWRVSYPVRLLVLILVMPVDTFTGLVLGYATTGMPGMPTTGRPAGAPSPVEDVHWGGAVMWIGGGAIMLAFIMIVFLLWSRDDLDATRGHGWLETVRKSNFDELVATHATHDKAGAASEAGGTKAATAASGGIDDDEHLAAYNAYLARLNQPGHRTQNQR
jgi:putative copper resistance protein D